MPKSRKEMRIKKRKNRMLDPHNVFGFTDMTPFEAVKRIIKQEQRITYSK